MNILGRPLINAKKYPGLRVRKTPNQPKPQKTKKKLKKK